MELRNRLAGETSPYLRQHRDNPVHWQPWNPETLALARDADRPILLSVGYSACHWCHVMAHECFEDTEVADLMNHLFVNIKVDREERPDIDQIYMAALAATGEQGGWPLTMFLTPDARPIWGGTYFPKHPRYGRPGFLQVLRSVADAWHKRRTELDAGAGALTDHLARVLGGAASEPAEPSARSFIDLARRLQAMIDPVHGGLSGAPKFPNAPILQALWLGAFETGDRSLAESVASSLRTMLSGGIYDHVGGGLCRYSTDERWIVPHFEKMLYDNAQLIQLLAAVVPYFGVESFRERIEETAGWLEREMRTPDGAFAASLDADSDGEEGLFYLWDRSEIESILGGDAGRFFRHFRLEAPSGWHGRPILVAEPATSPRDAGIRRDLDRLRRHRDGRNRPARDDKILVDWNALTIRALADAARQLAAPEWLSSARMTFSAICAFGRADGRLPHSHHAGRSLFPGLSSDYAAMINAAVSLYQATGEPDYLERARQWAAILDADYGDRHDSHFLTAADAADVPIRIRGDMDEATPSATSQIIEALVRLASATSDWQLQERAHRCAVAALSRAMGNAGGQVAIHAAAALSISPRKLVTVDRPGEPRLASIAARYPDPRRVDIALNSGAAPERKPVPGELPFDPSRPAAWLCSGLSCLPPIVEAQTLEDRLRADGPAR